MTRSAQNGLEGKAPAFVAPASRWLFGVHLSRQTEPSNMIATNPQTKNESTH
jgi:hypothetical protein